MRGVVTFVFDDGYTSVFKNAVPLLEKHHFPGVFAVTLDPAKLEQARKGRPVTAWQEWLRLRGRGHEIASHTIHHPNLTKLSDAELRQQLIESQQQLGAVTLVYPGGAVDDRVVTATKRYYKAARSIRRGFEALPPTDPWRLRTFNFSRNNFRVWKANMWVFWAWLTKAWLIETYHVVDDHEWEKIHTVRTADLARHLAFIAKLPIQVKTIKTVIEHS